MRLRHLIVCTLIALPASTGLGQTAPAETQKPTWKSAEAPHLTDLVQLTFADRFLKAGESYFSPDDSMICFQAIEQPAEGEAPGLYYQMYVADVERADDGMVAGLKNIRRVSPLGSSNTCGWFHPTEKNTLIFGSTLTPPGEPDVAGYQRGNSRYKWQFPKEMTIVKCDLSKADGTADTLDVILKDDDAYLAECSLTTDGRHLLFCRYREDQAPAGGDLFVKDLQTGREIALVDEPGYDGGPFFSPDEKFICYRSDRRGDNYLQLFVAELDYDDNGRIVGIKREFAVTDNNSVNWAPFWTRDSESLVYATSEQGHHNYEVYRVDVLPQAKNTAARETTKRRITAARGFDGLPVFDSTGKFMMWTSQRDASGTSQLWVARYAN